ncbi:TPA: ribonuclease HIII [Patescibacteria group bacterium]|nr:ribonuclease HIII [Patescibacteria group bacterium]
MSQNTVTVKLNGTQMESFSEMMEALGWKERQISNEYVEDSFSSPDGAVATLYSSGKLVLQGSIDFTQTIAYIKGGTENGQDIVPHIGVDEVGKGDYFGPLVVVACFVDEDFVEKISYLGFDDSKKFSDKKILDLYARVKDYPYYYPIVLYPKIYNDLTNEYGNLSILLAKQHTQCIETALEDLGKKDIECKKVVIDQFSSSKHRILDELGPLGKYVDIEQFHKGESDIAVAAASIIARGIFLEEFDRLRAKYDFNFPKGASNVIRSGIDFVRIYGAEKLRDVAKVSFKTTKKILKLV